MLDLIDSIVLEWSKRIPSGIIDFQNEEHKFHLINILNEKIDNSQIVEDIVRNIYDNKWERIIENTACMHICKKTW
jgi:hypothetical protein